MFAIVTFFSRQTTHSVDLNVSTVCGGGAEGLTTAPLASPQLPLEPFGGFSYTAGGGIPEGADGSCAALGAEG